MQPTFVCPSGVRITKLEVKTEHWWNVTVETEGVVEKLSHSRVLHKTHMDQSGIEPRPPSFNS